MDIELQSRLIKYALQYMRRQINKLQTRIVIEKGRQQNFSGTALNDFGAELGSTKDLRTESDYAAEQLRDDQTRLQSLMDDYMIVQGAWQEVRDRELREGMAQFWRDAQ